MDDHRKNAYRYLLYWAMLDIRPIAWLRWFHGWRVLNPFRLAMEVSLDTIRG